jgi:hypothetical protein
MANPSSHAAPNAGETEAVVDPPRGGGGAA